MAAQRHGFKGITSMRELTLFPVGRSAQPSRPSIERVLIAGVTDGLACASPLPTALVRFDGPLALRYLAEAELEAAGLVPSLWIAKPPPSGPNRRVLFETIDDEVFEQDESGGLWLEDQPILPGIVLAFGTPRTACDGELLLGERAALLIGRRCPHGWELRLRETAAVLWIHDMPHLRETVRWPHGWLHLAGSCSARADPERAC